jgi:hypothetical protein
VRENCIDLKLKQVVHIVTTVLQSVGKGDDAEFKVTSPIGVKRPERSSTVLPGFNVGLYLS